MVLEVALIDVTASNSTLRLDIAMKMPSTAIRSPNSATVAALTNSLMASTSWVTRVMRRPIGFWS